MHTLSSRPQPSRCPCAFPAPSSFGAACMCRMSSLCFFLPPFFRHVRPSLSPLCPSHTVAFPRLESPFPFPYLLRPCRGLCPLFHWQPLRLYCCTSRRATPTLPQALLPATSASTPPSHKRSCSRLTGNTVCSRSPPACGGHAHAPAFPCSTGTVACHRALHGCCNSRGSCLHSLLGRPSPHLSPRRPLPHLPLTAASCPA